MRSEETPLFFAAEVSGLTKMNWNNTRFDGRYAIAASFASAVWVIVPATTSRSVAKAHRFASLLLTTRLPVLLGIRMLRFD